MKLNSAHLARLLTVAVSCAVPVLLLASLPSAGTPGWDESGHAFAALRMEAAWREHGLRALGDELVRADFYTPLGRACYAVFFAVFGPAFWVPRFVSVLAWSGTLWIATRLARRLALEPLRDSAAAWTALFGASCTLGAAHARTGFLEPLAAFNSAALAWLYLRLEERPGVARAVAAGGVAACGVLTKPTYGLVALVACGLAAVVSRVATRVVDRTRPVSSTADVRAARASHIAIALASAFALPFAWWFVWPWPGDGVLAAEHRALFAEYLTKAAELSGLTRADLLLVFGLQCCWSLPVAALQLAGLAWGLRALRSPAWCVIGALGAGGLLAFVVYPYRIERFLVPDLFALWCAGAALCAQLVALAAVRWRPWLALGGAAVLAACAGVGEHALWDAVRGAPTNASQVASIEASFRAWREPYAHVRAPACGGAEIERVLDLAAQRLDGSRRFGWIGGTCTEIPIALVRWRLYQESRCGAELAWNSTNDDSLWSDPGWDEAAFREWARGFHQIVALDPPDPRDRPAREFERRFVAWLARDPDFRCLARQPVARAGRTPLLWSFYERRP